MSGSKTRKIVIMAFLIALNVILTRFLSIQTPIVRFTLSFIPIAVSGIMYGPWIAGIGAAAADLLGMLIFPTGAYFPGFTLTAFLAGAVYGAILYNKDLTLPRIILAAAIVTVVLNLGMDTLWLYILMGQSFKALLIPRLVKCAIMLPLQSAVLYVFSRKRIVSALCVMK